MSRNILLKLLGDGDDAKKTIAEVTEDVRTFGKEEATAEIRVEAEQAKREIAEVEADLETLPKRKLIELQITGDEAKLAALTSRLETLGSNRGMMGDDTDSAAVGKLDQRIGTVAASIDRVRTHTEGLRSDLDKLGEDGEQDVSRLSRAWSAVTSAVSNLPSVLSKVAQSGPSVQQAFSFVTELPTMLVAGLAALAAGIVPAIIGVVALGAAFLIALGPIVLLLAAVAKGFSSAVTAQQNLATAQSNYTSSVQAQKSAVVSLQQAQQNESTQRLAALEAEKEAVLGLHDAEDQLADAKLNITSTALSIQQAQLALQQLKESFSSGGASGLVGQQSGVDLEGGGQQQGGGSPLAYQQWLLQIRIATLAVTQAEQQHKDAIDQTADALNAEQTAQQGVTLYQQKGLAGYSPYQQAVASTTEAQLSLAQATERTAQAQKALLTAQRSATPWTAELAGMSSKLSAAFDKFASPAVAQVAKGLAAAFKILAPLAHELEPAFTAIGRAVGGDFVAFSHTLVADGPLIRQLFENSARLAGVGERLFSALFTILLRVANDAMPALLGWFTKVGDKFARVAKHPQEISKYIDHVIAETAKWYHWIGNILSSLNTVLGLLRQMLPAVNLLLTPLEKVAAAWNALTGAQAANQNAKAGFTQQISAYGKLLAADKSQIAKGVSAALLAHMQAGADAAYAGLQQAGANLRGVLNPGGLAKLTTHLTGETIPQIPNSSTAKLGGNVTVVNQFSGDAIGHDPQHAAAILTRQYKRLGNG